MAQETIFLCNFRVSVHGDWLCLQELNDIQLDTQKHLPTASDPMATERMNLLNVLKLVIKELLDSSLSYGRMIDHSNVALQQLFLILEHILLHRLKPKKGIIRDKRDFWEVLERIEKYVADARDITASVRELPNVRSSLGRARAWLRLALMQKKLSDYFRVFVDRRDVFVCEFYEEGAVMLEEEAAIICGLLVGLNVIDCGISVKDEDLDRPMGVIDFGLYFANDAMIKPVQKNLMEMSHGSKQMVAILDQKNYLEELNRHLSATVTSLQEKLVSMQTANTLMREDLIILQNNVKILEAENTRLLANQNAQLDDYKRQILSAHEDLNTERSVYNESRLSLDTMYQQLRTQLEEEKSERLKLENELIKEKNLRIGIESKLDTQSQS